MPRGVAVECTIRTNGVLLDDEWAASLAENHYLVGLSIGGPGDRRAVELAARPPWHQRARSQPDPLGSCGTRSCRSGVTDVFALVRVPFTGSQHSPGRM